MVLWENSNRFCGPDSPDSAGALCTLDAPKIATVASCRHPAINLKPLLMDCRWRTMNVNVANNTFKFTRSAVGKSCKQSDGCGYNGIFSIYGSTSPYKAWIVPKDISDGQNNRFDHNTYVGPWSFMAVDQGVTVSKSQWTEGFTDNRDGSRIRFDPQDAHSTFAG